MNELNTLSAYACFVAGSPMFDVTEGNERRVPAGYLYATEGDARMHCADVRPVTVTWGDGRPTWLRRFMSRCHRKPIVGLVRGSRWRFQHEPTPWEPKESFTVKVLDVKDGWVRYDMGGTFSDERMEATRFVRIYRQVGQP